MSEEKLLRAEEVAVLLGVSVKTIDSWYAYKRINPKTKYAKMLPKFIQHQPRQTRYWREGDIEKLRAFQSAIPHGRNGILGCVTQKYINKERYGNG